MYVALGVLRMTAYFSIGRGVWNKAGFLIGNALDLCSLGT
jgi:hypothetical protein